MWVIIKIDRYAHSQNLLEDFTSIHIQHFVWENTAGSVGTTYNSHYFISGVYFWVQCCDCPRFLQFNFLRESFQYWIYFFRNFWRLLLMPSAFVITCTNTKAWKSNLWADAHLHCVISCKMWTELEREVKNN